MHKGPRACPLTAFQPRRLLRAPARAGASWGFCGDSKLLTRFKALPHKPPGMVQARFVGFEHFDSVAG
jgi:hypothetical protein